VQLKVKFGAMLVPDLIVQIRKHQALQAVWLEFGIRLRLDGLLLACNIENQNDDLLYIGNELWEDDKKIKYGELAKKYGGGGFNVDYAEDCQVECYMRHGICGAWSYERNSNKCHLFSVNACCGQEEKYEYKNGWTSGYICPYCWSTKGECPCTDEYLQLGIRPEFLNGTIDLKGEINKDLRCQLKDTQNRDGIPGPLYGEDGAYFDPDYYTDYEEFKEKNPDTDPCTD